MQALQRITFPKDKPSSFRHWQNAKVSNENSLDVLRWNNLKPLDVETLQTRLWHHPTGPPTGVRGTVVHGPCSSTLRLAPR